MLRVPLLNVPLSKIQALGIAAVKAVVCIVGITAGGRLLIRPLYKKIAELANAEIFAATTLLVVLGTSFMTQLAGGGCLQEQISLQETPCRKRLAVVSCLCQTPGQRVAMLAASSSMQHMSVACRLYWVLLFFSAERIHAAARTTHTWASGIVCEACADVMLLCPPALCSHIVCRPVSGAGSIPCWPAAG